MPGDTSGTPLPPEGDGMRDGHRVEAERLLTRAVEEEVRRSGGRTDGNVLLSRARGALDAMAEKAAEEYGAYTPALDEASAGQLTFRQRYAQEGGGTPLLVAAVAAVSAVVADVALGTGTGTAVGAGVTVGVVGAAATLVKVAGSHVPAAQRRPAGGRLVQRADVRGVLLGGAAGQFLQRPPGPAGQRLPVEPAPRAPHLLLHGPGQQCFGLRPVAVAQHSRCARHAPPPPAVPAVPAVSGVPAVPSVPAVSGGDLRRTHSVPRSHAFRQPCG